jgi:hypothetical protein
MKNTKLEALHKHLIDDLKLTGSRIAKIAAFKSGIYKEALKVKNSNGLEGRLFSVQEYVGSIHCDRFKEHDDNLTQNEVFTAINLWLFKNDVFYSPLYNQSKKYETGVSMETDPLAVGDFDKLSFNVNFTELQVLITDENGIYINAFGDGTNYRLANQLLADENFEKFFLKNT